MQKKKLLGSALALSLFFPAGTINAELLKNFKLSGQMDFQGTNANNTADFATHAKSDLTAAPATLVLASARDRIGDMQTRVMIHMDWDLLDDVHAKVTLAKNNRNWGTAGGNAHGNALSETVDAGGIQAATFLDQAYIKIDKVFGALDATMGRQFYGESGDLVVYFGPSDKALYGMPITALDALRADWSNETLGVTAVAGKIAGTATGAPQPDTDLRGITVMCKGHENMNMGTYLYNRVIHNTGAAVGVGPSLAVAGGKNDNLWIVGLKGKYTMGMAWVAAEFAKNFGQNRVAETAVALGARNYTGWAFKLDLGANSDMGVANVSPWLHFGYGTGDSESRSSSNKGFTAINGDYRPGSIYGRFSNNSAVPIGLGNVAIAAAGGGAPTTLNNRVIWGFGVKATPSSMNKLTAGLSFWDFRSQTWAAPTPPSGVRPFGGNKHLASELDLDLTWKHSENVTFGAGAAKAIPGGVVKDAIQSKIAGSATAGSGVGVNSASLAYLDVRLKF